MSTVDEVDAKISKLEATVSGNTAGVSTNAEALTSCQSQLGELVIRIASLESTINSLSSGSAFVPDSDTDTDTGGLSDVVVGSVSAAAAVLLIAGVAAVVVFVVEKQRLKRRTGDENANSSEYLPASVAAFVPLAETRAIAAICNDETFKRNELQIGQNLSAGSNARSRAILDASKQLARLLSAVVDKRCSEAGAYTNLKTIVNDGVIDFQNVYGAVWDMITKNDLSGTTAYAQVLNSIQINPQTRCIQRVTDVVTLLQQAAVVKKRFGHLVRKIVGGVAKSSAVVPSRLKSISRIVEKAYLDPHRPGHFDKIFDVVRGMVICKSMTAVAIVLNDFASNEEITLVRIKDRFSKATSGGWRDCQVCFYLNSDPNMHICEVQIVHKNMLVARKGLPGHSVYCAVRNAQELLDILMACQTRLHWGIADARRAGFDDAALRTAGFCVGGSGSTVAVTEAVYADADTDIYGNGNVQIDTETKTDTELGEIGLVRTNSYIASAADVQINIGMHDSDSPVPIE